MNAFRCLADRGALAALWVGRAALRVAFLAVIAVATPLLLVALALWELVDRDD